MRDCPETGPTGVFLGGCGANATLNRSDLLEIKRLITIEKAEACWLLGADRHGLRTAACIGQDRAVFQQPTEVLRLISEDSATH